MSLKVKKIKTNEQLKWAMDIRQEVFVQEQNVPESKEYDEFEDSSHHFIAFIDGKPCGTARWRITNNGIKLERFAVQKAARSNGVGSALVEAVLEDINNQSLDDKKLYLHAQLSAAGLYAKFDFKQVGEEFEECAIRHIKMERSL